MQPKTKLKDIFTKVMAAHKLVSAELKLACHKQNQASMKIELVNIFTAIQQTIENVVAKIDLEKMGAQMVTEYHNVFEPIPHVNQLPTDVYCNIQLKDATQQITSRLYSTLQKYREAWKTLIEQHLNAGHLWSSNSAHDSLAFLIPKVDLNDLPQWVNSY